MLKDSNNQEGKEEQNNLEQRDEAEPDVAANVETADKTEIPFEYHLCPTTLFRASKFDECLNQKIKFKGDMPERIKSSEVSLHRYLQTMFGKGYTEYFRKEKLVRTEAEISSICKIAVDAGPLAHGALFCGIPGCGKTMTMLQIDHLRMLESIIESCCRNNTIIFGTTNMHPDDLEQIPEMQRIYSRLNLKCRFVIFESIDFRLGGNGEMR